MQCLSRVTGGSAVPALTASALADLRHDLANQYRVVAIDPVVIDRAMHLAETRALHGCDAVQLAAALSLRDELAALTGVKLVLVSADAELNAAAEAEGLAVENPNDHVSIALARTGTAGTTGQFLRSDTHLCGCAQVPLVTAAAMLRHRGLSSMVSATPVWVQPPGRRTRSHPMGDYPSGGATARGHQLVAQDLSRQLQAVDAEVLGGAGACDGEHRLQVSTRFPSRDALRLGSVSSDMDSLLT